MLRGVRPARAAHEADPGAGASATGVECPPPMPSDAFSELFASRPVLLAPMEDVSDAIFLAWIPMLLRR